MLENNKPITSTGLCIGVDLMLESVFYPTGKRIDSSRKIPNKVNLKDYTKYYVSLYSYIRTFIRSYSDLPLILNKDNGKKLTENVVTALLSELYVFLELFKDKIEVIFYVPDYASLENKNVFRETNPVTAEYQMKMAADTLLYHIKRSGELDIYLFKDKLPSSLDRSLITTSVPIDLLNVRNNPNMKLLELHTGKLKDKNELYTKFNNIKGESPRLPFVEVLLYIFRDKGSVISNMFSMKERKEVYELCLKHKLKPYDLKKDIRGYLENMGNKVLVDKIKKLPKIF